MRPAPPHRGHGWANWKSPWSTATLPDPPHCGHVVGEVPGSAPDPPHVWHGAAPRIFTGTVVPRMVSSKEILAAEGLERIDAQGAPFDPERHEALMQSGTGEGEPVVADVLRPGYTLKGRVIRPAGVKVARK